MKSTHNKSINLKNKHMKKQELAPPENQHQQVLYYLYNWDFPFSLREVINDSMFVKMQTRLSEIERVHGTICTRTRHEFVNKFGRKSTYNMYEAKDREQILNLYSKY